MSNAEERCKKGGGHSLYSSIHHGIYSVNHHRKRVNGGGDRFDSLKNDGD